MTACILKIIAVITMVIDHTGVIFFDGQEVWRMIGRTAMPLYAFMLVEGVRYTRRKEGGLRRYLLLLVLLAVISEPCYDFAFEGVPVDPEEQNQILQFATFVFAYWLCQTIRGWLGGRLPAGPAQYLFQQSPMHVECDRAFIIGLYCCRTICLPLQPCGLR